MRRNEAAPASLVRPLLFGPKALHSLLMKTRLFPLLLLLSLLAPAPQVLAHPHSFVECRLEAVFDENGLAGFQQHWTMDPMLTLLIMEIVDQDGDFQISPEEVQIVHDESFVHIGEYGYFTDIRIDGAPFEIKVVRDFTAHVRDGKLIYEFFVPCRVDALAEVKEVKVAVYDPSFYAFVLYVEDAGGSGVDPTLDPLFGDPAAGASPEDFQRFTQAVGIGEYSGDVHVTGLPKDMELETALRDAPEMTFYFDQITPQAFVLRFRKP